MALPEPSVQVERLAASIAVMIKPVLGLRADRQARSV
jgi:hypothetical protein